MLSQSAQVLIVFTSTAAFSNAIGPTTRDDFSNSVSVLDDRWWRERDRAMSALIEDFRRCMQCQAHRAPPVSVDLAASDREPGFPVGVQPARPVLRHRHAGQRARVPIRSRPGFRAAA